MNIKKLYIIISLFLSLSIAQEFSGDDAIDADEHITLCEACLTTDNPDLDECVVLDDDENDGCRCYSVDGNDEDCEFNDYDGCVDAGCDWWCDDYGDNCILTEPAHFSQKHVSIQKDKYVNSYRNRGSIYYRYIMLLPPWMLLSGNG